MPFCCGFSRFLNHYYRSQKFDHCQNCNFDCCCENLNSTPAGLPSPSPSPPLQHAAASWKSRPSFIGTWGWWFSERTIANNHVFYRCWGAIGYIYIFDTSNLVFWRLAAGVASVVVTLLQLQTSPTQLPPKLQFSHFTLFVGGQWTLGQCSFYQPHFVFVMHPNSTLKYSVRSECLTYELQLQFLYQNV